MTDEKVQPFDSFSAVYKVLVWAGYYKLLNKPKNRCKWILHQIYRPFGLLVAVVYNLTHIMFFIQRRDNVDDMFDCAMIEIPQVNLVVKILTLNFHIAKIDKINKLLNGPIFAAYTKKDEELLLETQRKMHRLSRIMNISVTMAGFFWPASHFMRRYQDPTAHVTAYVPFETDTWAKFSCSVLLEVIPLLWVGYGHLALDCLVATYYAQAEVQLKIIKYNLEHLFDTDRATDDATETGYCLYMDAIDKDLRGRFVHYVQRYEAVAWYTKEIGDVFNSSMTFQFFTSTATLCVVTYRMSSTSVMSVQFMFLTLLLVILLSQVFIYCYFGNLVQYESDSVTTSVYLSDWLSASPQLRRIILIAMLRWSRALTPRVSGIVPLSLNTYVSILRSAYSLFALLSTKQ